MAPLDRQKAPLAHTWHSLSLGGHTLCPQTLPSFLGLGTLTFLPWSWLGSSGASSPISRGFMNLRTKSRSRWKARKASWGAGQQVLGGRPQPTEDGAHKQLLSVSPLGH